MVHVYVVTHKKFDWEEREGYVPIAVGKGLLEDTSCSWLKDNTEENISEKNSNYCELTAQYWIWKNDKSSQIIGLCHYRRFLSKSIISNKKKHILNKCQIEKYLSKYDVLLPYKGASIRGNLKAYCDCGFEKDISVTRNVIQELYPDYIKCFDRVFNGVSTEVGNMMITTKDLFNRYSEWLFSILFEVEKRIDLSDYSNQEARIYGYISERLLSVWLEYNKFKIKRFRVLYTEKEYGLTEIAANYIKKVNLYYLIKKLIYMMEIR